MGSFEKSDALVRTERRWLFASAIMIGVVGLEPALRLLRYAVDGQTLLGAGVVAYFAAVFGMMLAWSRWWHEARRRLHADEHGLSAGGVRIVERGAIRHGYVLERGGRCYVRLGRALRHVEVEVADRAEGEAMLRAMRLDPTRSVAEFKVGHGTWAGSLVRVVLAALPVVLAPGVAFVLGGTVALLGLTLLVASVFSVTYSMSQTLRVSVGADGIRVRRLLAPSRFIAFSAIDEMVTDGKNIRLRLGDGEVITMNHSSEASEGDESRGLVLVDRALEGRMLVERVNEQVAAHRAKANADPLLFARAGRETGEWLRAVVTAADANASYRSPAVPPDELWRIVEDAAAPATARAGAAVALRQELDDAGRARLHTVADACAAPRLRVALETVASCEDGELLRDALEPLDDDVAPLRKATLESAAARCTSSADRGAAT